MKPWVARVLSQVPGAESIACKGFKFFRVATGIMEINRHA